MLEILNFMLLLQFFFSVKLLINAHQVTIDSRIYHFISDAYIDI